MIRPPAAAAALAGFADVLVLLDAGGVILGIGFGVESRLASELPLPIGERWLDHLTPDSLARGRELIRTARPDELGRSREVSHPDAARGRTVPMRYAAIAAGDAGEVLLLGRDLSPQVHLQRQLLDVQQSMERDYARLRAVETRYRILFHVGATPMLIVDAGSKRVLEANAACHRAFSLTPQRINGRTVASLFDEHDADILQAVLAGALESGDAGGSVLRAAVGDARFELSAHFVRQEDASLLLLQARPVDEPPRHVAVQPDHHASLFERLPEGFVVTDGGGVVIEANRAFLDLAELPKMSVAVGRRLDEWVGRSAIDLGVILSALQERGTVRGLATVVRGAYGREEAVEISAVRIVDSSPLRVGFLVRAERRPSGPALRATIDLPRSVDQMKDLIGSVSMKDLVRETTDVIERLCIEAALELTNDNRASAAEMLGLSRQSLYAKLHRFGLGSAGQESDA